MKISNFDVKSVATIDDIKRFISNTITQIINIVNGKITFKDNFDGASISTTFSSANVDTPVVHNLGRNAIGYILVTASASMSVYTGSQAGNTTTIFLRSNNPGSATLLVY
jgi:hypothetical protein